MNGQYATERGGRQPGVGNVLQGGGAGSASGRIKVMGLVISNGDDSGWYAHRVSMTDHREAGSEKPIRDVGDTEGKCSSRGTGDEVCGHVHWLQAGDIRPLGGTETYL